MTASVGQRYKLVPSGGEAEFEDHLERALEGEVFRDAQVRRQRKDGSLVHISFSSATMTCVLGRAE